ncbi:hypothetical protein DFJ43DRAFT_1088120 [Lentinula guzmanii]|uniref:BTB domain-containing protein n=1 Tax=Lentinula guzmanii TaxID=2804957 RepID=A0AA38MSE7_9AGAR|nr:hypothetical protein DFJ43DRAFT_1088120 [Lentinula guzmanii]
MCIGTCWRQLALHFYIDPTMDMLSEKSTLATKSTQLGADAPFPFNDHEMDAILRSSDRTDFYVHTAMLSVASPVFRDLFELAQAQSLRPTSLTGSSMKRCVEMAEDRHSLDLFLRWCDTRGSIPLEMTIPDIATVIRLADKFQVEGIASRIAPHLYQFIESEPLSVYAIAACHASFTHDNATWGNALARRAAKQLLMSPMPFQTPTYEFFKTVPAIVMEPLYQYHRACGMSVRENIQKHHISWLSNRSTWPWLSQCTCTTQGRIPQVPDWWRAYLIRLCELLENQPSATTILALNSDDDLMSVITHSCHCTLGNGNICSAKALHDAERFHAGLSKYIQEAVDKIVLDFSKRKMK